MAVQLPIYMDYNATTPVDPKVFAVMAPFFCDAFGNAASTSHSFGWAAKAAVDKARMQVAALIGSSPNAIIWTSGSTESNNLAIFGACKNYEYRGKHIITQTTEHKAVLDPFKRLQNEGWEVTWLGVDKHGRIDVNELAKAIRHDTLMVSIMWANNEVGTMQPMHEIGRICKSRGVIFHTDATQAVGKVGINVDSAGVDLLSMSAHKLYGPKGSGALYVRNHDPKIELSPLFEGGGHQLGMRSGTLNVTGIVGLGEACEISLQVMADESSRLAVLRDRLERGITTKLDGVFINGGGERLPHCTNLSFAGVDGGVLLSSMDDVAVSSGSACTSAVKEPSYVLKAIGVPYELALASLRFSLGRHTSVEDVDYAIDKVVRVVKHLRELGK